MAGQDTPPSNRDRADDHSDGDRSAAPPSAGSRASGGPRHALPEDMQADVEAAAASPAVSRPAQTSHPAQADPGSASESDGSRHAGSTDGPRPAYEDYEAPESNLMPATIAAIVGGVLAAVLLLRLLRLLRGGDKNDGNGVGEAASD